MGRWRDGQNDFSVLKLQLVDSFVPVGRVYVSVVCSVLKLSAVGIVSVVFQVSSESLVGEGSARNILAASGTGIS